MQITRTIFKSAGIEKKFTQKEILLLSEIGLDQIPAATSFVQYFSEMYNMSQSGIWYTLKKLKKRRVVDFTERGEVYKPLSLTEEGIHIIRKQKLEINNSFNMDVPMITRGR
ncbi:MAG: hypothetical protein QXD23_00545 [Candidatus Micrarchaeaceae archaeon]